MSQVFPNPCISPQVAQPQWAGAERKYKQRDPARTAGAEPIMLEVVLSSADWHVGGVRSLAKEACAKHVYHRGRQSIMISKSWQISGPVPSPPGVWRVASRRPGTTSVNPCVQMSSSWGPKTLRRKVWSSPSIQSGSQPRRDPSKCQHTACDPCDP